MATSKAKQKEPSSEYTPTPKINIRERLDAIKYSIPTAKSVISSRKSSRGPSTRVGKLSGLQTLKTT